MRIELEPDAIEKRIHCGNRTGNVGRIEAGNNG